MISADRSSRSRRNTGIVMAVLLVVIILFAFAPLISVLISSWIASANDCVLNEGGVNPCVIGGIDYGETLTTMFVAGWFMFFTFPAGVAALLLWFIVLIFGWVLRRSKRNPDQ